MGARGASTRARRRLIGRAKWRHEIHVQGLFATPVAAILLPDADERNAALSEVILRRRETHPGIDASNNGGWHSTRDFADWSGPHGRDLVARARSAVTQFTRDRDGKPVRPNWIVEAWANVNQPESSNACHYHPGSFWSASYYVDDGGCLDHPEYGGEFEMMDPRGPAPMMHAPMLKFAGEEGTSAGSAPHDPPAPRPAVRVSLLPVALRAALSRNCASHLGRAQFRRRSRPYLRRDLSMSGHILVIDQGTTSTRAIAFDERRARRRHRRNRNSARFTRIPAGSSMTRKTSGARRWRPRARPSPQVGGARDTSRRIGIANQRETTLIWDRKTGEPLHNAIVWQDRRTADRLRRTRARRPCERSCGERTGLVLDPYFSATKIAWILDHVDGRARPRRAGRTRVRHGRHFPALAPDQRRASTRPTRPTPRAHRCSTSAPAIGTMRCSMLFDVPRAVLPRGARHARAISARRRPSISARRSPILAMAGDQQSALVGQVCLAPGMAKATYGTGGFILLNTGDKPVASRHGLLTTIAYQWDGKRAYALEGSIFSAGATVQWLRDGLGVIAHASEAGTLAAEADPEQEVYLVPAFAGLGAPHWRADARGALLGLTRGATRKEIARAALESVGFQTDDLIAAMTEDFVAERRREAGRRRARRRRHGGERLDDAVPRRHPRRAGRPADLQGNDRARRRVPRGLAGGALSRARRVRPHTGASTAVSRRR